MPKKRTYSRKKRSSFRRLSRRRLKQIAAVFVILLVYFFYDMPGIDDVRPIDAKTSILVLANDGTPVARYGGLQGKVVDVKNLPKHMVDAVLSIEDRRFYGHFGIDPLGLARAMWVNITSGRVAQGGSTITQQLAKNLFLTPDRTLKRKAQEALMALRIELKYTKDEILTAYLNRVYFGAGAYGISAAAKTYFDKDARKLTLWESATLAGLLKAPSRFSPSTNPELSKQRAITVLAAMEDAGRLNKKMATREIDHAKARRTSPPTGDMSRYFADWVIDQIDSFIEGADGEIIVKTTLDPKLQALAVERQKQAFERILPEDRVSQAALVAMGHDGAVLAMTGGVNYRESQFNRATQARRQPGSAFKPFVYLAALESGLDPQSEIEDSPIRSGSYRPANYDEKYFGNVTLSYALAKSMNTATIRLLQMIGVDRLIDVAARAGIDEPVKAELSSGLGTGQVSLIEITGAYTAFANSGYRIYPYAVLSITDKNGKLAYTRVQESPPRVFSSSNIAALNSMLQEVVNIGTGTGAHLAHATAAGKTGTTQNYRDAWFIGFAGGIVTGVWMGNDDETQMIRVTGGKYPAMLWRDFMNDAAGTDLPAFVEAPESSGAFTSMINRWSSSWSSGNNRNFSRARPSNVPVYNE